MLQLPTMFSTAESRPLERYQAEFNDIPGFFQLDSMVLWDFFFGAQARRGISGDLLEIGVYKGRSAVLGALYMRPEERAFFVDISLPKETQNLITRAKPQNCVFLERRSGNLLSERALRESPGGFRWCHIDGDHTGYATTQDLQSAAYLVSEDGIICVDDFFSVRYPQLTAAVYAFLGDHASQFRMLFCGANKCYFCSASAYAAYEHDIRDRVVAHIRSYNLQGQIYKTSYSSDNGCFSMGMGDCKREVYGMDENPDFIPF
jgi:hypothetical protein